MNHFSVNTPVFFTQAKLFWSVDVIISPDIRYHSDACHHQNHKFVRARLNMHEQVPEAELDLSP